MQMEKTSVKANQFGNVLNKSIKLKLLPHLFNQNILILDDDPLSAETLKRLLEELGFTHISIVSHAKEAMKLIANQLPHFDIIFSDYHLPDMKGSEFTQQYKNIFPQKETPIICYSSDVDKVRRECIEAGIDDFLSKPVSLEDLKELLECWICRYKAV